MTATSKKSKSSKKPTRPVKTSAKKPVAKKAVARKPVAKKPVAKKPVAKKAVAKKPVPKKAVSRKATVKKPVAKKPAAKVKSQPKAKPAVTKPAAKTPVSLSKQVPREVRRSAAVTAKRTHPQQVKVVPAVKASPKAIPQPVPAAAKPAPVVVAPPVRSKGKVLPREFLLEVGNAIRQAVLPFAREARGREIIGTATSGDPTFELDRIAEKALLTFLKNARLPVAYYSENAGYTTFTNTQPQSLLVVDPIDGTRAAKSGFEGCVIAIASTRVIERPTMADVDNACVMEILGSRVFYAERGKGVKITQGNHVKRYKPVRNLPLEHISWSMTVPARPAELIFPTAGRLIDLTALKGGFFSCNSTSFSLTRLLTNQLDACIDIANRFYRDVPYLVRDHFINAGRGTVLGIAPYDLAASLLVAEEGGCTVTDAYGKSFSDVLLLDTSVENQRSLIAAADPALHEKLLNYFETRIRQYEDVLRRRAERAAMTKPAPTAKQATLTAKPASTAKPAPTKG